MWMNLSYHKNGGPSRDRTDNLLLAGQVLSQLRYEPIMERHAGIEPAAAPWQGAVVTTIPMSQEFAVDYS